jgi:KDO2-lipid IV(A) lauroyltransferase
MAQINASAPRADATRVARPGRSGGLEDLRRKSALLIARPIFGLALLAGHLLPASWLISLAGSASRAAYHFFPGLRANLLSNARHILGESSTHAERARLAREVLRSFSRFMMEWVSPKCLVRPEAVLDDISGREHFERAAEGRAGIIAVTIHMGNYELPSRELAALRRKVSILFDRERIDFLERLRSRSRRSRCLEEIAMGSSRFSGIQALERLRQGGIVLLAGDQVSAPDAEPFPFLYGNAPFSLWPARLSRASGAPILPAFCVAGEPGRYRLHLEQPIFPEDRSPREITAELVTIFESYVRDFPGQWLMVHEFWRNPSKNSES